MTGRKIDEMRVSGKGFKRDYVEGYEKGQRVIIAKFRLIRSRYRASEACQKMEDYLEELFENIVNRKKTKGV